MQASKPVREMLGKDALWQVEIPAFDNSWLFLLIFMLGFMYERFPRRIRSSLRPFVLEAILSV